MPTIDLSIFRKDKTNVGDWWSPPHLYFPLNIANSFDLNNSNEIPNNSGSYIVGGGGLGNESFRPHLKRLTRPDREYRLIAWGVGADVDIDRKGRVGPPDKMNSLLDYFEDFDEVGTRIYPPEGSFTRKNYRWVPCASCMSPIFRELSDVTPSSRVGYYSHKRVPLTLGGRNHSGILHSLPYLRNGAQSANNRGSNLRAKLEFMARFEFIVTNSYHGVYWATLLGRRVICQPFKNGLHTFRHAPTYLDGNDVNAALEQASDYPEALGECRAANIEYYRYLTEKYGDI